MTCIVGLIDKEGVYIGADSAAIDSTELSYNTRADTKVFKKGDMIFGYAVSFRMGQLLKYKLRLPSHPRGMDDFQFMVTLFIDSVKKCFDDNGYVAMDTEDGGSFLVGYKGNLYTVLSDYQVAKLRENYAALGCGESFALGALFASKERDPLKKIELALNSAAHFSMGVRPPFEIIKLAIRKKPITKPKPKK